MLKLSSRDGDLMTFLKRVIFKLLRMIFGLQGFIKFKECAKGLYRYPQKMIGRVLPSKFNPTNVLVFAAHPDDEILGLSATLLRHKKNKEKVAVVYVTDGTGRNHKSWQKKRIVSELEAKVRYEEGVQALSLIGISRDNLFCLGIPDGGTQRYLKEIARDVHSLINKLKPSKIYTHCIECGHIDHDFTSFVVRSVCEKMGYSNVYEWAEYSPSYPLGIEKMEFEFGASNPQKDKVHLSNYERNIKKKMLAIHKSQDVEQFYLQGEAIRKAKTSQLAKELFKHQQYKSKELMMLVNQFLKEMEEAKFYNLIPANSTAIDGVRHTL